MAYEDLDERIGDTVKRKTRSYVKRKQRRTNRLTSFICLVSLLAGAFTGVYVYEYICADDCFELLGEKVCAVELDSPDFNYYDDGVKIIEFGRDISDKVLTETNMTDLGDGRYTVDTTVPGKYYIKYTVDSPKYSKVTRIRTFVVGGEG